MERSCQGTWVSGLEHLSKIPPLNNILSWLAKTFEKPFLAKILKAQILGVNLGGVWLWSLRSTPELCCFRIAGTKGRSNWCLQSRSSGKQLYRLTHLFWAWNSLLAQPNHYMENSLNFISVYTRIICLFWFVLHLIYFLKCGQDRGLEPGIFTNIHCFVNFAACAFLWCHLGIVVPASPLIVIGWECSCPKPYMLCIYWPVRGIAWSSIVLGILWRFQQVNLFDGGECTSLVLECSKSSVPLYLA